jgi:hypothetical protein
VKSGTETKVSCIIIGLNKAVKEVSWLHNGNPLTGDGYTMTVTSLVLGSQTATLLVEGSHVTKDKDYTCRVTSGEYEQSPPQDTVVKLNVYGKSFRGTIFTSHILHRFMTEHHLCSKTMNACNEF